MKKILLSVFTLSTLVVNAQTFVSTTPEDKNIILEEYTGISCGYCPDGHKIGQQLHDANPEDVFLINIHTGGYATPQGPGTDFNTSFGAALGAQTGLTGYPSGSVNRHVFSGGNTALSRSDWASSSAQLLSQPSPVNVGVQATVDMATNTLIVDVEVYYTGTQTVTTNMLNIAVVQNNIEGPQSGMSANPASVLPNGQYNHNHMLRHMLTGQWGETISNIASGTLYSEQFTWVMPSDIAGVSLDPTNIDVVAFVSEGNQEILSGTEVSPSLVFANAYDAYLVSSNVSDNICSNIAKGIQVEIKNYGNLPLTTLDITYDVNGGTPITFPWAGYLTSGQATTVTLSNISYIASASNTVNVSVSNPNGNTDQNTSNDNTSTSFINQSIQGLVLNGITPGNVTIDIFTDGYPSENTWEIIDDNGTVIASGSPTTANSAQAQATATLNPGTCYAFYMYDSYGDGMSDPANGNYEVLDGSGTTIALGSGNFGFLAAHYFETSGTNPCTGLTISTPSTTLTTCNQPDGTASIQASGGTPVYTYLWEDGQTTATATALLAGSYSVTVTDANGCSYTDIAGVGIDNSMSPLSTMTNTNPSCNGDLDGTIDITITGGTPPYNYLWSNGSITEDLIGISAGTYLLEYTDDNVCVGYVSATISEPNAITAQFTTVDESGVGTNDGSASATSTGIGPYTYMWSDGQITQTATGLSAGNYTCIITDASGCSFIFSVTIVSAVTTDIKEIEEQFLIYPNPVKDMLTINGIYKSVTIYDIFGKIVLNSDYQKTINTTTLRNGVYFLNINSENAITFKKINVAK